MSRLFIILLGCIIVACTQADDINQPNVIVIFVDDMGYGDLSCYGSELIKTPRLDRMAEEGARFTDFYAAASICTPSRAALLTGSYPQRAGLYMGINPKRPQHKHLGLHPDEETIPELLREVGYATLAIGKWHLGTDRVFNPLNHGFDEYFGMPHNFLHSPEIWDGYEVVQKKGNLARITGLYTDRVLDFIERKKDEPFFIYLAHTYPHGPLVPNPKFKGKSEAGKYGDVIEELDWSTGAILDKLDALGLAENTLVLFTSDNGAVPTFVEKYNSSGPLTGSKYTSWEGGQREPFIAYWPGRIPAGQVVDELATTMDILPTVVELAGAELPENEIDGKDIWPLLSGEEGAVSPYELFYFYNNDHLQALRWQDWKIHFPRTKEMVPWWQKNRARVELDGAFLVNLEEDPAEVVNVAEQHPEVVKKMLQMAEEGREKFGDFQRRGTLQRETGDSREL